MLHTCPDDYRSEKTAINVSEDVGSCTPHTWLVGCKLVGSSTACETEGSQARLFCQADTKGHEHRWHETSCVSVHGISTDSPTAETTSMSRWWMRKQNIPCRAILFGNKMAEWSRCHLSESWEHCAKWKQSTKVYILYHSTHRKGPDKSKETE